MATSEFAKRQLKKHGWTEGSGLGKQEHGRSEPIKVSLKMDKTGVGHDHGKDFTDHWWLRVFNEAAQKIGKKQDGKLKEENKSAECKNSLYKNFVKSTTLTNGVEEKHRHSDSSSEDSSDHEKDTSLPTLNDIHKFCGGATGHKAARFGMKMGGKLARIAQHDKMFEERLEKEKLSTSVSETDPSNNFNDNVQSSSHTSGGSLSGKDIPCENVDGKRKKKKHKKQRKEKHSEESDGCGQCVNEEPTGEDEETVSVAVSETVSQKNKTKQKHKKRKVNSEDCQVEDSVSELPLNIETQQDAKSRKRQKRHSVAAEDIEHENEVPEITISQKKKRKIIEEHICSNELLENSENNNKKTKKTEERISRNELLVETDSKSIKKKNKSKKQKV